MKMMNNIYFYLVTIVISFSFSPVHAETCYDLIAGQQIIAGSICVVNDENNLIVKYQTINDFMIDEAHLFVDFDLSTMPQTKKGSPKIGNFPYKAEELYTTYYEFIIPLSSFSDSSCGDSLVFVAHAALTRTLDDGTTQQETAYSQGERIVEKGSWAMFSDFIIACEPEPPIVASCETAFALGDTTFIDLGLTVKRWGWQVGPINPGTTLETEIYAGAGQNNLSNGTIVGYLSISYDGLVATVEFNMLPGFVMQETHLYVGEADIDTIAPGQYGNIHVLDFATFDRYVIDGFSDGAINIVAHAVSCSLL